MTKTGWEIRPVATPKEESRWIADGGSIVPVPHRMVKRLAEVLFAPAVTLTTPGPPAQQREVFAEGAVSPQLISLARHLFCRDGPSRSAVILVDLHSANVSAIMERLEQLYVDGWRVGLLPISSEAEARWVVLKSLLVRRVQIIPNRVLALTGNPAGPPCRSMSLPYNDAELLLFSGHSNAFDLSVGERVLCSYPGRPDENPHAFPCWHDGACFRLERRVSEEDWPDALIRADRIRAHFVVLLGCDVFPPGRSITDPALGIVPTLCSGPVLGAVASLGLRPSGVHSMLFWLAELGKGAPTGDVWRRSVLVDRQLACASWGFSMALIGNPDLVLRGLENWAKKSIPDPHLGHLKRVPRPQGTSSAHSSAWWAAFPIGEDLLVWSDEEAPIVQSAPPPDALFAQMEVLDTWRDLIATWNSLGLVDHASSWLRHVHFARDLVQRVAHMLHPQPGIVLDTNNAIRLLDYTRDSLDQLWEALHCLILTTIEQCDLLVFRHLTGVMVHTSTEVGPSCVCGQTNLCVQKWQQLPAAYSRSTYACLYCGSIGEDDGQRRVTLARLPASVSGGEELIFPMKVSAATPTRFRCALVVEAQGASSAQVGPVVSHAVKVGTTEIAVSIRLGRLEPGLRTVGAVAVMDGVITIARRVIPVLGNAGK